MRRYTSVACIDFETYFDQQYSLRAKDVSTTSYIRDERYQTICMGLQLDSWDKPKVYGPAGIRAALKAIDWRTTAVLAHHTQFDGLILTHHYGVIPAFWLDTMAMSAVVFGVDDSHSLDALSKRLGRAGKEKVGNLVNVKGKRQLTNEELVALAEYCSDDVEQTLANFRTLSSAVPETELRIIDMTIRMYVEPTLQLDGERVEKTYHTEVEKKSKAVEKAGVSVKALGSSVQFAEALKQLGVEPPTKISARTGLGAYAFAKNDLDFKALALHPDESVRNLVDARLRTKSGLLESRSKRILGYAGLPLPMYLKYWAARTGRWGGGDKVNWQNLPRRGDGVELRRSLTAPSGCLLVISDASQIEARLNAWDAGQQDKLDAFARGDDLYIVSAADIYHKPYDEITDDERFMAKTLELGCGYGAGAPKVNMMFKIGQFGPALNQPLEQTVDLVAAWRAANNFIVAKWKRNYQEAQHAFMNQTSVEAGPVTFEGFKGDGFIHLPNGTYIRYPSVAYDNESRQMYYQSKTGPVKLYGGLITENKIQALARCVLAEQLIRMEDELPHVRVATTTHDEVMLVVQACRAVNCEAVVKDIMSTTPEWAPGLPLNAKTLIHSYYNKS